MRENFAHFIDPLDVVKLIETLATGGAISPAMRLATDAYAPRPTDDGPHAGGRRRSVATGLEPYWYRETLPTVVEALPQGSKLVRTLRAWLEEYQLASGSFVRGSSGDTSYMWRPSIGPHEQNQQADEIGNALVDALRDAIPRAATDESGQLEILKGLFTSEQTLVRRVAIQGLVTLDVADESEASLDLAFEWLMSDDLSQGSFRREYSLLAKRFLPALGHSRADSWSDYVLGGPPWPREHLERVASFGMVDNQTLDETVAAYRRSWLHGMLSAVGAEALPRRVRGVLTKLNSEFGEYLHAEFPSYVTSWVGERSPVATDEIAAWPVDQLLQYLATWEPDKPRAVGPETTRDGLASTVRAVVRADSTIYARAAPLFRDTSPVYVRAVLEGLREAVQDGVTFDWVSVLVLCRHAVAQVDVGVPTSDFSDADTRWNSVQRSVISLLEAGIESVSEARLPADLLDDALSILTPLTSSADPTPDQEARYGGDNMDPLTLSLNTIRPAAIRAIVHVAARVLVSTRAEADSTSKEGLGSSDFPTVVVALGIIDGRLGFDRDPSLATAAVFGESLVRLAWIDGAWLTARMPRLMALNAEYRDVVASTSLAVYQPSSLLLETLRPWIGDWLTRAVVGDDVLGWRAHRGASQLWGDHLVILYCTGRLKRDDDLVLNFFESASVKDRAETLGHLGWVLTQAEVGEDFLQLAMSIWDWRMHLVETGAADIGELAGFGRWVISGKFSAAWWLPRLQVAASAPTFASHGNMGERLADVANTYPDEAMGALTRLLASHAEPYRRFDLIQHAPVVLAAALDLGTDDAKRAASDLIDGLGRRGHLDIMESVSRHRSVGLAGPDSAA